MLAIPFSTVDTTDCKALLTPIEAAEFLRLSPRTLANLRTSGRGPRFVKLGHIRYRLSDLLTFVDKASASSTSEANLNQRPTRADARATLQEGDND